MRFICFTALLLLLSCKETKKKKSDFKARPYSELAILMIQLEQNHNTIKKQLEEGKRVTKMPLDYYNLLKSKPTFQSDVDSIFMVCAKDYINCSEDLIKAVNQKKAYNKMVKACINCHLNNCGGPIKRISRLYYE